MVTAQHIIGQDFNGYLSDMYDLSMLIGMDRFFYVITDQHQVIALKTEYFPNLHPSKLQQQIQGIIELDECLQLQFNTTTVGLASDRHTLIPEAVYNDENRAIYLQQNAEIPENHTILADVLVFPQAKHLYAFPQLTHQYLSEKFPNSTICYAFTQFINTIHRYGKTNKVYANLSGNQLQIVFFDADNLRFANVFNHRSVSDIVYFIMLVYHQLRLDTAEVPLLLSGAFEAESPTYTTLYKYIQYIEFTNTTALFGYDKITKAPQNHHFLDLLSVAARIRR